MNESKHFASIIRRTLALVFVLMAVNACQRSTAPAQAEQAGPALTPAGNPPVRTSASNPPGAMQSYPVPQRLTDFALRDQRGQAANRERLRGHWSLLFFGFTRCPDICPPTLSELSAVRQSLEQQGLEQQGLAAELLPQIVFISVDPVYDTPQRMAEYLALFQPQNRASSSGDAEAMLGLSGDPAQIMALTLQLGVPFGAQDPHRSHRSGTQADAAETADATAPERLHSGAVFVVDPDAAVRALFPPPLAAPAQLRAELLQLLTNSRTSS